MVNPFLTVMFVLCGISPAKRCDVLGCVLVKGTNAQSKAQAALMMGWSF